MNKNFGQLTDDSLDLKILAYGLNSEYYLSQLIEKEVLSEYFYLKKCHQWIYSAMIDVYQSHGILLTPEILNTHLNAKYGQNSPSFSQDYMECTTVLAMAQQQSLEKNALEYYITELKKRYKKKYLVDFVEEIKQYNSMEQVEALEKRLEQVVPRLDGINRQSSSTTNAFDEVIGKYCKKLEIGRTEDQTNTNPFLYLPEIDYHNQGCEPGDLVLFAAAPGGGKSLCMLHVLRHAWKRRNYNFLKGTNVLWINLEMSEKKSMYRFISALSGVPYGKLKNPKRLTDKDMEKIREVKDAVEGNTEDRIFYVETPPNIKPSFVKGKFLELQKKYPQNKIDLIIIDYAGLMAPDQPWQKDWEKQLYVSQELKQTAKELHVPIISAVQANRRAVQDTSANKDKNLGVLARAFNVAADADLIIYVELKKNEYALDNTEEIEKMIVQLLKNREGPLIKFEIPIIAKNMQLNPERLSELLMTSAKEFSFFDEFCEDTPVAAEQSYQAYDTPGGLQVVPQSTFISPEQIGNVMAQQFLNKESPAQQPAPRLSANSQAENASTKPNSVGLSEFSNVFERTIFNNKGKKMCASLAGPSI